jgi:hypothetical protein
MTRVMKLKKPVVIAAVVALVVLIAGGLWVAKKLYDRKVMRDYIAANPRWELVHRFEITRDLSDTEMEEAAVDLKDRITRYEVLRPVVSELDLIAAWEVADADAAMGQLESSMDVRAGDGEILLALQDSDKERLAETMRSLLTSFRRSQQMSFLPPPPPGGPGE